MEMQRERQMEREMEQEREREKDMEKERTWRRPKFVCIVSAMARFISPSMRLGGQRRLPIIWYCACRVIETVYWNGGDVGVV